MDQVLLAADSAIQCTNGAGYYMHFEDFGITQNVKRYTYTGGGL